MAPGAPGVQQPKLELAAPLEWPGVLVAPVAPDLVEIRGGRGRPLDEERKRRLPGVDIVVA